MKSAFEIEETNWLNNEILDTTIHPHIKYNFDITEMTLLNTEGEVKIGDSILKLTKEGYAYIVDGNVSTLIRIRAGDETAYNEPNVITNIDESKALCDGWEYDDHWDPYANKRKVYVAINFHSYPWKISSRSKIISYKKKWNGNWKRYRISLGAANQVYWWDRWCDYKGSSYSNYKYKYRKSYSRYTTYWGSILNWKTQSGYTYGGYYYNSSYKTLYLTW